MHIIIESMTECHTAVTRLRKSAFSRGAFHSTKIPGILCDEWNIIFRFVGLTTPRSSGSKFRAKIRDQTRLFYLCLLALGLFEDSEVETNDVLGEGITYIRY